MPKTVRRFVKFRSTVIDVIAVAPELDKQAAARALVKAKKVCAYERADGLVGEIGVPRKPEHAGRIFKAERPTTN